MYGCSTCLLPKWPSVADSRIQVTSLAASGNGSDNRRCNTAARSTGPNTESDDTHPALQQIAEIIQNTMRAARGGLLQPLIERRGPRSDRKHGGACALRHNRLDDRIVPHDTHVAHWDTEPVGNESQCAQRRLSCNDLPGLGQPADGTQNRKRITDRSSLFRREERYIGRGVQLRTAPDRLTGGLDVLHTAVRVPAYVDRIDLTGIGLSGKNRLNTGISQSLPDTRRAEYEHALHSETGHVIGHHTGGGNHLRILNRQPDPAQFGGLFLRWI